MYVLDGHTANLIIVAARTDAGVSLFAGRWRVLTASAATALATMDQTRKQAKLDLSDNTPATLIGDRRWRLGHDARDGARPCRGRRSPPSRSVAPRCVSTWRSNTPRSACSSVARSAAFQAIKHKCADMLLEVESAKSAAYYAGWAPPR